MSTCFKGNRNSFLNLYVLCNQLSKLGKVLAPCATGVKELCSRMVCRHPARRERNHGCSSYPCLTHRHCRGDGLVGKDLVLTDYFFHLPHKTSAWDRKEKEQQPEPEKLRPSFSEALGFMDMAKLTWRPHDKNLLH